MPQPTAVLFYVSDLVGSSTFYEQLLGRKPKVSSPFYAMFKLDNGFELALWAMNKVEPPATQHGSSAELGFLVPDNASLDLMLDQWTEMGILIIQQPKKMYFGGTHFVGLDPDGHRLRVATPD